METLPLPKELEAHRLEMETALGAAVPGDWPDITTTVYDAEQPQAIARVLIDFMLTHRDLEKAKVAYLFKETMGSRDKVTLGKASKASAELHFLADCDFVIKFNWKAWLSLTAMQRIAIVDHELCHCSYDGEADKFVILHHDVEEFSGIVKRWGLWKLDLEGFGEALKQFDMFDDDDDMKVKLGFEGQEPIETTVGHIARTAERLGRTA